MNNGLISTQGLTKKFGGHTAVSTLDLTISSGEIRCLIGPNGAGKSTALALLSGIAKPTSGHILYKGRQIEGMALHERARLGIGVKFQIPAIFPDLSVHQNLQIALRGRFAGDTLHREIAERLAFLDLKSQAQRRAGELSHGQKQWLELGLAIGCEPDLLLLDEPTAGMTQDETKRTGDLLLALNRTGMTIVAVEHDTRFVKQIAHCVSVLHLGHLFCEGSVEKVMRDERVADIYFGKAS